MFGCPDGLSVSHDMIPAMELLSFLRGVVGADMLSPKPDANPTELPCFCRLCCRVRIDVDRAPSASYSPTTRFAEGFMGLRMIQKHSFVTETQLRDW